MRPAKPGPSAPMQAIQRAFARQFAGKLCQICKKRIPFDRFHRHVQNCRVADDDDECQVLMHLTPEDKQRIIRENIVDLDLSDDETPQIQPKIEVADEISTSFAVDVADAPVEAPEPLDDVAPLQEADGEKESSRSQRKRTSGYTALKKSGQRETRDNVSPKKKRRSTRLKKSQPESENELQPMEAQEIIEDVENIEENIEKRPRRITRYGSSGNIPAFKRVQPLANPEKCSRETPSVDPPSAPKPRSTADSTARRAIFLESKINSTTQRPEQPRSNIEVPLEEKHKIIKEELNKRADFYHSPTQSPVKSQRMSQRSSNSNDAVILNDHTMLAGSPVLRSPATSYHLRFVMRILHKVFCYFFRESESAINFWKENLRSIHRFLELDERAQLLLIRMILRKRRWLTASRLGPKYLEIAEDLVPIFNELAKNGFMETISHHKVPLEEALNLLQAPELQTVCKKFKTDYRSGRVDLIKALLKSAKQKSAFGSGVGGAILKTAVEVLGPTYRLYENTVQLFNAVLTLYAPVQMDSVASWDDPSLLMSQQLIFTMLNVQTKKAKYPAPLQCASNSILRVFNDYPTLERYIKVKEEEQEMAVLSSAGKYSEAMEISDKTYGELQHRLNVETDNVISQHASLPHNLRKYTDSWILVRIMSHGVEAAQRLKNYRRAVEMLEFLLKTEALRVFCPDSRGVWWDRLALNLDAHLKQRAKSLEMCLECLADDLVAPKEKLLLQDRAMKLAKNGEFEERIRVPDPKKVTIKGVVLGKNLGDQRTNHFMLPDENGVYQNRSVEAVALDHYISKLGYTDGVHAEGGIWHTLFGLMFYDIIFDHEVESAWLSEFQDHPSDLNTREFYQNRRDAFDNALTLLEEAEDYSRWFPRMNALFHEKRNEINNEIHWGIFNSFEQVKDFLHCCKPVMLSKIFHKFITDNRNHRSGFPDLTVWNTAARSLAVVEVKGPNDRLSTKQRLWLQFFDSHDVEAVVCHVVATNCRNLS